MGVRPLLLDLLDGVAHARLRLRSMQMVVVDDVRNRGELPFVFGRRWGKVDLDDVGLLVELLEDAWLVAKRPPDSSYAGFEVQRPSDVS